MYLGKDSICYKYLYEMKSENGWDNLIELTRVLNKEPQHLEKILNVDQTLWMLAFNNVLIYKSDLQGTADSLSYSPSDSMLYFYNKPVLWSEENQMSADSVWIQLSGGSIDKLFMVMNAFVIAEDTLKNFNQIKGRKMVAQFKDDNIHHVDVQGNGESLYFALEEAEIEEAQVRVLATVGMNKIICSNMKINFLAGKLNNISFYVNPDASFIPPHELKKDDLKLKGFNWRGKERPTRDNVVSNKN